MAELKYCDNIGHTILAFVIPFSFSSCSKIETVNRDCPSEHYPGFYSSNDVLEKKVPAINELRCFYMKDADEYTKNYLATHPYFRVSIKDKFYYPGLKTDAIISVRMEGYGSFIIFAYPQELLSVDGLLKITKNFQDSIENSTYCSIEDIIRDYLFEMHGTKLHKLSVGKAYPFYNLYDENGKINDLNDFIDENSLALYGLLQQDITGWKRTNPKIARDMLGKNLSRRDEYAFFLSATASLEIDNSQRMATIESFAQKQGESVSFMQIKLLIERILSIETLTIQKFLLLCIDEYVGKIVTAEDTSMKDVLLAKSKINNDLCDYYNIKSQNESHVSGMEWIEYGQAQFGIGKIHKGLMDSISVLDSFCKDKETERHSRGRFYLSLFSLILSLYSVISIVEWIFQAPFFQNVPAAITWYITLGILLVIGVIVTVIFFVFNSHKQAKKRRKRDEQNNRLGG